MGSRDKEMGHSPSTAHSIAVVLSYTITARTKTMPWGASILTYETSAFDCPLKLVKSVTCPSATPWLPSSTEDLLEELVSLPCKSDSLSLDRIKEKAGIAFTANLSSFWCAFFDLWLPPTVEKESHAFVYSSNLCMIGWWPSYHILKWMGRSIKPDHLGGWEGNSTVLALISSQPQIGGLLCSCLKAGPIWPVIRLSSC